MLFPAQSIGVDQPSLHSSGQLSHHGTKSRRLEAKVAECCRVRIKCGCPGFWVGLFDHPNPELISLLPYQRVLFMHIRKLYSVIA